MVELPMAALRSDLKPTVSLEQGNQFPDLHGDSLPRARDGGPNAVAEGAPTSDARSEPNSGSVVGLQFEPGHFALAFERTT
jgi:hypothetical protein